MPQEATNGARRQRGGSTDGLAPLAELFIRVAPPPRARKVAAMPAPFLHRTFVLACLLGLGVATATGRETNIETGIRDQVLHMGGGVEPATLDPHLNTGSPESAIISVLFEALVTRSRDGRTIEPAAARAWDIADGGRTYTFHLRDDLRWSNGEPLTARDFHQSFLRALTPQLAGEPGVMMYPVIGAEAFKKGEATDPASVGFEAPDDHTLVVRLREPMPHFLQLITSYPWLPVHRASVEAAGGWTTPAARWTRPGTMIGNGPFVLKSWTPNSVLTVVRNPHYHDAARVRLHEIRYYPIESTATEERAFRAGQLHVTYEVPESKIDAYQRDRPEVLRIAPRLGVNFLFFNVTAAPFTDVRVRRAFAFAIDRDRLVTTILKGGKTAASSYIQPGMGGFEPQARFGHDPERARTLLAEAGFPGGRGFPRVEYLYNTLERNRDVAEALQAMWRRQLGIEVTLKNEEWKVFVDTRQNGNFQVARAGWNPYADEPTDFFQMLVAGSTYNDARWTHEEYTRLYREASTDLDRSNRHARYHRMEEIIAEEMPLVPLFFNSQVRLVDTSVQNWTHNLFDDRPIEDLWLAGQN